jgi:hypothetical protein
MNHGYGHGHGHGVFTLATSSKDQLVTCLDPVPQEWWHRPRILLMLFFFWRFAVHLVPSRYTCFLL